MGKASSAKKVARAARVGGAKHNNQRRMGFPLAITGIVVVGVLIIVFARDSFTSADAVAPKPGDHWHEAYGVFVCDAFLPNLSDAKPDTTGIHTHADGIIHIHPFTNAYSGENATLGAWGEVVGVDFGADSIEMPDGTAYENGYDCNGQPATVSVYKWAADDPTAAPQIFTSNFGDIHLDQDRAVITIAVVPEGTEVPKPDSVATLDNLTDVGGTSNAPRTASTLTVPVPSSSTTAPGAADSTSSTAVGSPPNNQ
jgi:hypothetical protein